MSYPRQSFVSLRIQLSPYDKLLTAAPTIICPDDLIATVAALTLAIRVIGGSIGYCVYYNVFICKYAIIQSQMSQVTSRAATEFVLSQIRSSSNLLHRRCNGDQTQHHLR